MKSFKFLADHQLQEWNKHSLYSGDKKLLYLLQNVSESRPTHLSLWPVLVLSCFRSNWGNKFGPQKIRLLKKARATLRRSQQSKWDFFVWRRGASSASTTSATSPTSAERGPSLSRGGDDADDGAGLFFTLLTGKTWVNKLKASKKANKDTIWRLGL